MSFVKNSCKIVVLALKGKQQFTNTTYNSRINVFMQEACLYFFVLQTTPHKQVNSRKRSCNGCLSW
jgi:hypothetical protein